MHTGGWAGFMATILVVDDYRDSADALALCLRQSGHDVHTAGDGYQAIAIARRQRPNYVLLDLALPGLDGYQVAATLRHEVAGPLVIIAITGFASEEYRKQALEAGCDDCISKPIDPRALIARICGTKDNPDHPTSEQAGPNTLASAVPPVPTMNRQVEVVNDLGFNLRAADKFVTLARSFQADIRIACGDRAASGLSVLDLTTLPAARGARLEIAADGPDAEAALTALAELIERGFDEDE
jgi:phosphotransferase system HPr (HPr) family protein